MLKRFIYGLNLRSNFDVFVPTSHCKPTNGRLGNRGK